MKLVCNQKIKIVRSMTIHMNKHRLFIKKDKNNGISEQNFLNDDDV